MLCNVDLFDLTPQAESVTPVVGLGWGVQAVCVLCLMLLFVSLLQSAAGPSGQHQEQSPGPGDNGQEGGIN